MGSSQAPLAGSHTGILQKLPGWGSMCPPNVPPPQLDPGWIHGCISPKTEPSVSYFAGIQDPHEFFFGGLTLWRGSLISRGENIFHPFNFAVVFCQSFASFPFLKFQWTENVTFTAVPSAYLICIIFCGLGEVKICHHLKALKGVIFGWGGMSHNILRFVLLLNFKNFASLAVL